MVCGLQSPILASQLQPPIFITIIIIIIALIAITVTIIIIIINLKPFHGQMVDNHQTQWWLQVAWSKTSPFLVIFCQRKFWSFSVGWNCHLCGRALLQKSEVWTVWLACDEGGVEIIAHQLLLFCAQSRAGKGQIEVQVLFQFSAILIDLTCLTLLLQTCCLEFPEELSC